MRIEDEAEKYRQQFRGAGYHLSSRDIKEAFEEGAEWMQKKMIDKACDWIQCMALDYMQGDITDVKWESMLTDFRKEMED